MKKGSPLTAYILTGMVLGIVVGYFCHGQFDGPTAKVIAEYLSVVTDVFLRLIKMIIALLVFSTLTVGIAHMGDVKVVGRVGGRAMGWFIVASVISLSLGLVLSNLMQLGEHLNLALPAIDSTTNVNASTFTFKSFVAHLVPKSPIEAMANNEILQVVVFSLFFGSALVVLGPVAKDLTKVIDQLSQVMLRVTSAIMVVAPFAVFAGMASVVSTEGLSVLGTFAKFIGGFYLSLAILGGLLMGAGFLFIGSRVFTLFGFIRDPLLLAFSTASSEAAYPRILRAPDKFGVKRQVSSFVLSMGYSFNLDGSMMYCSFAVLFIAQAYGIDLPISTQITMLALLMLTSKGMAGVPRASLVVIALTLNQFGIPEAGLLLIIGIDHFLDMGRAAINVVGNSIASAVVAKWEGSLLSSEEAKSRAQAVPLHVVGEVDNEETLASRRA